MELHEREQVRAAVEALHEAGATYEAIAERAGYTRQHLKRFRNDPSEGGDDFVSAVDAAVEHIRAEMQDRPAAPRERLELASWLEFLAGQLRGNVPLGEIMLRGADEFGGETEATDTGREDPTSADGEGEEDQGDGEGDGGNGRQPAG